ncbi:MAG: lipoprotein insertase outer membrane protein LolB [Rhodocyclaceae bacterium]
MRKFLCSIILPVLLAACASTPPAPKEIPPRPARESITSFIFDGRAVVRQGQKADTMRISWQHSPAEDDIGFANPLGHVMAELQRDSTGARWTTSDGERYEARSPDMLISRLTDAPVPIDALALWVTGRVRPDAAVQRDNLGRIVQASDGGWLLSIQSYENEMPNAMPSVLEVRRGTLQIRLAIEVWQL